MAVIRRLREERDWWRIRDLLVETFPAIPPGWNWDIRHWDGGRFHNAAVTPAQVLARTVALVDGPHRTALAAVHDDGPGQAVLELRPEARELEPELVAWAEAHLAAAGPDGAGRVELCVQDDDRPRQAMLVARGWSATDDGGWYRTMSLEGRTFDAGALPAGYRLNTPRPTLVDAARMAELLNATFRRTIHSAREYATFMGRSPSFEADLHLVAVAEDGSFAAHVGVTRDRANRHAIVEPVATHPDHRRRGLARILILEGLGRAAALGARTAAVETGEAVAANALYEACGFGGARHVRQWRSPALGADL